MSTGNGGASSWPGQTARALPPASLQTAVRHLVELADAGSSLFTIRVTAAAIARAHKLRNEKILTRSELVRDTLRGLARNIGRLQTQVAALTDRELEAVRNGAGPDERVFGFGPRTVANRVKAAARAASLGEGFSGHSGRVGMAKRMSAWVLAPHADMKQGRWKNPSMVASYTRGESAGEALHFL